MIYSASMKRRKFIRSIFATGIGAPLIIKSKESRKLRIALIGASGRGSRHYHWLDKEEVTALCDADTENMTTTKNIKKSSDISASERYSKAKLFQDYRELFEKPDLYDAVVIATPDHHHYPAAIRSINAGKATYVEKPLTYTFWEAMELEKAALKSQVPTQMGNQGMGGNGWRLAHSYVEDGAIGDLKEVHIWTPTNEKHFSTGIPRPEGKDSVPKSLDWDLWLGPSPERPYKDYHYHPFRWRGWVDFGGGTIADWWCHLANVVYKVYDPGFPDMIDCLKRTKFNNDSFPKSKILKFHYAKNGSRPSFDLFWYDGDYRPKRPKELEKDRDLRKSGVFLMGTKGTVWVQGGHNNTAVLIPESKRKAHGKVFFKVPEARDHYDEFVQAAKGIIRWDEPLSNFGYAAPFTAVCHLGNISMRLNAKLKFDTKKLQFKSNHKANALLTRTPRKGWY